MGSGRRGAGKGQLAQSNAILTFVGRGHGQHPSDPWEGGSDHVPTSDRTPGAYGTPNRSSTAPMRAARSSGWAIASNGKPSTTTRWSPAQATPAVPPRPPQ